MLHFIDSLVRDEEGATMVEYGLLVALIAMVAFAGVSALGINVNSLYAAVAGTI
jgi:pilus assembly protein Flp/PilA